MTHSLAARWWRLATLASLTALTVVGSLVTGGGTSGATVKSAAAPTVVRIADVEGGDALYFAVKTGLLNKDLAKYNATAEIAGTFTAESPALQALAAGSADVTSGSITATEGGLAGESDVEIFAYEPDGVGKVSQEAIVVKANSGITSVKDLEGKTVAVNQAGTGEYMLDKALTYYHIPESSVKKVYLLPPAAATAFASGSVDAWATFSTYIPEAEEQDAAKVLVGGNQIGTQNDGVEVVNTTFAKAHPQIVKAIYEAAATRVGRSGKEPCALRPVPRDHRPPVGIGSPQLRQQVARCLATGRSGTAEGLPGRGELLLQGGVAPERCQPVRPCLRCEHGQVTALRRPAESDRAALLPPISQLQFDV